MPKFGQSHALIRAPKYSSALGCYWYWCFQVVLYEGTGCNALLSRCFFPRAALVCFPWPDSWFLVFGLCVLIFDCHIYYNDIDSLWAVGCIGFPAFLSQSAIRISIRFAIVVQAGHSVGIFISLLVFSIERLVVCFLAVLFRNIWLWSFLSNARVQKQPLFCVYHTWYCYQSPFHWVRTWNCYLFTSKFKPLWWRVFLKFQWQTSALHQVFRGSIAFPFQFWVWGSYFSFLFLRFSESNLFCRLFFSMQYEFPSAISAVGICVLIPNFGSGF